MQFSILELFSSVITYSPMIAWFLAGFIGIFFAVISLILFYHWKRFGIETTVMTKASVVYFTVSIVLFVTMVVSTVIYLNSI